MQKSIIFLLVGSLVIMLVPNGTSSNMNIISNAMAIELHPSIDGYSLQQQMYTNTDYELYKDDSSSSRNHYNYDDGDEGYDYPEKPIFDSLQTEGTFFVSDAGESHGGFEFTAEYKTEFDVTNGRGTLIITQITGLGDPLEKHVYSITDLKINELDRITMNIDENPVELVFVESDEIWNHQFDNNYIASWGGFAPENEFKGMISPTIFPGLPDFWYVELRVPASAY
jgi:hypothetical protein